MAVHFGDEPEALDLAPLPERLRKWEAENHSPAGLLLEAADRIEQLERELEQLRRGRLS